MIREYSDLLDQVLDDHSFLLVVRLRPERIDV